MVYGNFNEEAQAVWDFARCQRSDGTFYGTRGKCKQGKEVGEKEEEPAKPPLRKKKSKAEEPAPEPPKEEKGYKPKEDPEARKGLRGLKDRLLGGRGKDLDGLVPSEKEIYKERDERKQILYSYLTSGVDKATADKINKSIERTDRNAEIEVARRGTNQRFADDLKKNLPPKVKATVDKDDGSIILSQKVGRNLIQTTFNQSEGFNYQVNGKYDAGTVKDRKEQLRIAMAVRAQYDALVRSLPEGTVIKTSPYDGDGGGAARQKAYEKIGFGKPNDAQEMFAMKKNGRMVPVTAEQHRAAFENPDTVWFSEEGDSKEEIKAWFQIVTGMDVGV